VDSEETGSLFGAEARKEIRRTIYLRDSNDPTNKAKVGAGRWLVRGKKDTIGQEAVPEYREAES
jgi:hypothetical protein